MPLPSCLLVNGPAPPHRKHDLPPPPASLEPLFLHTTPKNHTLVSCLSIIGLSLTIDGIHLHGFDSSIQQKSLSRLAFGHFKGALYNTASQAVITLVSDQDFSERPNRHIINTLPPPTTASQADLVRSAPDLIDTDLLKTPSPHP
ncbi:hypothetical protein VTL71DRAFT_15054 [Oculimacula yallundae]|uniref:Uncharacterized protein n=1 Tax=Oculimacula yallundae TaxID=86028 RepID=A0ABR4CHJ0_9HELO